MLYIIYAILVALTTAVPLYLPELTVEPSETFQLDAQEVYSLLPHEIIAPLADQLASGDELVNSINTTTNSEEQPLSLEDYIQTWQKNYSKARGSRYSSDTKAISIATGESRYESIQRAIDMLLQPLAAAELDIWPSDNTMLHKNTSKGERTAVLYRGYKYPSDTINNDTISDYRIFPVYEANDTDHATSGNPQFEVPLATMGFAIALTMCIGVI